MHKKLAQCCVFPYTYSTVVQKFVPLLEFADSKTTEFVNPFQNRKIQAHNKIHSRMEKFQLTIKSILAWKNSSRQYKSTDRAEIFTEASHHALTPSKPCPSRCDSDSSSADLTFDDFVDLDQSVDDFQNFFGQMDTECEVDYAQTVLNIVRFSDPPNRPTNRNRIDRQNHLLTILTFFRPYGRRMWCWPCRNIFEHCTITGSTESAVESVPNRRSDQSTGMGFNLSAL